VEVNEQLYELLPVFIRQINGATIADQFLRLNELTLAIVEVNGKVDLQGKELFVTHSGGANHVE
jgi:hypothetical protein